MYKGGKISAIIAARMGSSRFQGKTLTNILNKPMLERIVERIQYSDYIDNIIVATTILREDDAIVEWCEMKNVFCFRGSDTDVLNRLYIASKQFRCQKIVEILGDNPLVHSEMIDASVEKFFYRAYDYVATITNEYPKANPKLKKFPIGVRVQVMSFETLKICEQLAQEQTYREHATSYIAQNPAIFKTGFIEASGKFEDCNKPDITFAVNVKKNMKLIESIFNVCYPENRNFSVSDAIKAFYDNNLISLMGNE